MKFLILQFSLLTIFICSIAPQTYTSEQSIRLAEIFTETLFFYKKLHKIHRQSENSDSEFEKLLKNYIYPINKCMYEKKLEYFYNVRNKWQDIKSIMSEFYHYSGSEIVDFLEEIAKEFKKYCPEEKQNDDQICKDATEIFYVPIKVKKQEILIKYGKNVAQIRNLIHEKKDLPSLQNSLQNFTLTPEIKEKIKKTKKQMEKKMTDEEYRKDGIDIGKFYKEIFAKIVDLMKEWGIEEKKLEDEKNSSEIEKMNKNEFTLFFIKRLAEENKSLAAEEKKHADEKQKRKFWLW